MVKDGNYRERFVAVVAELKISARLYIAPTRRVSQRRARDACLEAMVPDLVAAGVSHLYLESCDQDRADRAVLSAARMRAAADDRSFYFDHRRPHEEPMLWVPDVIAWAYGKDQRWRARIEQLITTVTDVQAA